MIAAVGIIKRDLDRTVGGGSMSLFGDVGLDDSTPINVTVFMLHNPIVQAALICFMLGLGLSGLVRLVPAPSLASLVPPTVFLTSYAATYQQVPSFPPVGAVNKIFYIALAAALVGFVLDLLKTTKLDRALAVVVPGLIVGWIGLPRFANGDLEAVTTACALWLGGSVVLWRLKVVAKSTAERNGGSLVGIAMLMALMLAFAPVALLGGSSTSLMLCFVAVAGLGAVAIWEFLIPREAFGASSVLGAGSGFFAVVSTVTLITQQIDSVGLSLLLLVPYVGQLGAWLLLPPHRIRGRARQVLVGLIAGSPVLAVVAVLLLRHPEFFASMRTEQ
jgi:hypothetical protein